MKRNAFELCRGIPQRVFNATLGHFMAANPSHQGRKFRSFYYAPSDHGRSDEIGNHMPRGIGGLGVVGRRFGRCDLTPSAGAVGHNFNQKNSPVLHSAKTRFKRRLQLHVYFTKCDGLNLHKAPRRNSVSDCSSNPNLTTALRHGRPRCELRGAPPEGIRGSTEKHDSNSNTGSDWLHCNRVGNQGHGRSYENDWSERISWYAIRTSGIRRAFAVNENACRCKRIKNPADKNHVGQELLIRSARSEHQRPQSRRANGESGRSKPRMDSRERRKEESVLCHRVIDARSVEYDGIGRAEYGYED